MGYHHSIAVALLAASLAAAQDDPTDVLFRARDKWLAMTGRISKISCTETIERRCFTRVNMPFGSPSCDRIEGDRRRGRRKLRLDRIDRLRLRVSAPGGIEGFCWTGAAPRFIQLSDMVESGAISTGSLGSYVEEIFAIRRRTISS
ncbi:MAG: hypothetical protein LAO79_12030 [Acidobacteriia bacterium]|nr:hypothetical protein [Terriglobia bacterium]